MDLVDTYVKLAKRPNTQRSYASAVQHFQVEGRGLLPATAQSVAHYLAQFANTLSINTLRARLAGISRWHIDHGFLDPTKSPLVSQVLKGIRTVHNTPEKRARPVEFELLAQVSRWLERELESLSPSDPDYLRNIRDHAMLLIGFWRGFRSDELTRLQFEHVSVTEGVGMQCYLPTSKADRQASGRTFQCPALSKLCPVTAFQAWQIALGENSGPVFRRIDRWGHVSSSSMAPGSVVPWLRGLFERAGVPHVGSYTSHSLRRGFANWANSSGWNLKELMDYVGWSDYDSALRYLDVSETQLSSRFEAALENSPASKRIKDLPPTPRPTMQSNVVTLRQRPPK
jgi:integrase